MSRYVYVYVGEAAEENLRVGLQALTWGWKNPRYGPLGNAASDVLAAPGSDTYLVLVQEVSLDDPPKGWPRTKDGDLEPWWRASFQSLLVSKVVRGLYETGEGLWLDDIYPFRVGIESTVPSDGRVFATQLQEGALAAIRDSTLRRGCPVLGPSPYAEGAEAEVENDDDLAPDRVLSGLDDLNGVALSLVRREQSKLRKARLKGATVARCSICHRGLPAGLIRLAHIKRRSVCTPDECLDLSNTFLACTLGCDELFERGFISVAGGAVVVGAQNLGWTPSLKEFAAPLVGSSLLDYTDKQAEYFSWHREDHGVD